MKLHVSGLRGPYRPSTVNDVARPTPLPLFPPPTSALSPLDIVDQLEKEFGLNCYPVTWPIGSGDRFQGVYHRPTQEVHLFAKSGSEGRNKGARSTVYRYDDPELASLIEAEEYAQLLEDMELLEVMGDLDMDKVRRGRRRAKRESLVQVGSDVSCLGSLSRARYSRAPPLPFRSAAAS